MQVAPSQQVMLEVRFLEVNREAGRKLGVNWFGANPAGNRGFNTGLGNLPTGQPVSRSRHRRRYIGRCGSTERRPPPQRGIAAYHRHTRHADWERG